MYIEVVPNRRSRPAILLREGWREGRKVRKRTLANRRGWPGFACGPSGLRASPRGAGWRAGSVGSARPRCTWEPDITMHPGMQAERLNLHGNIQPACKREKGPDLAGIREIKASNHGELRSKYPL